MACYSSTQQILIIFAVDKKQTSPPRISMTHLKPLSSPSVPTRRVGRCILSVILFVFFSSTLSAQLQRYTVSGTISDGESGETIIGANIVLKDNPSIGTVSNNYGFFSITLPAGKQTLLISYIGYTQTEREIDLSENKRLDIPLYTQSTELQEVVVTAVRKDENVMQTQVGVERLEVKEISKIPVLLGERDILKSIQLLPGVKSAGEGSSGFAVRGGNTDQNLILLDEATVYNASHLMGFFSTFNSDAIKDVTLFKGNAPAQFGGRLSSVLDIRMHEGNNQHFGASGGIGLISSRLNVEGPIVKGKGSFIVSGRRSYADLFIPLMNDPQTKNTTLYFYDLNIKANYTFGEKDRLYISSYLGRDKFGQDSTFRMDWGNITATIRWNHIMNNRMFSNTSLIFSDYSYNIMSDNYGNTFKANSMIRDFNLKQEFQYYPNNSHTLRFGLNSVHHTLYPQMVEIEKTPNFQVPDKRYGWENALYFSDEWKISPRLSANYGIRLSSFTVLGGGNFFTFDSDGDVVDSVYYKPGAFVKTYFHVQPRLSVNYLLTPTSSLKAGYARNVQNLHLISNSTMSSPSDLWIPSSINVKPEVADQVSIGYFRNFLNNEYELSIEAYYKTMQNQIDYRNGADLHANQKIEGELLYGKGRAYGAEFFLRKRYGKLNGWISYTLSRTERLIDGINDNRWYPTRTDCTHDIAIVAIYSPNAKWDLSANWVYNTGKAVTYPSGKYYYDGAWRFYYTERNGYRMPAYHRLDLGATLYIVKTAKRESSWNFSIYNAYGRENPYFIRFQQNEKNPDKIEAEQTSLFRWVPSITYNFKF